MEMNMGPMLRPMFSRTALMAGLVLASSALAQESAQNPPALTPRSFDLSNDSIRKAVRDSAETQFAAIQTRESKPAERDPIAAIDFSKPVKPAPARAPAPVNHPAATPVAAAVSEGILFGLIDTLVDAALDDAPHFTRWVSCKPPGALETTAQIPVLCPMMSDDGAPLDNDPKSYVPARKH